MRRTTPPSGSAADAWSPCGATTPAAVSTSSISGPTSERTAQSSDSSATVTCDQKRIRSRYSASVGGAAGLDVEPHRVVDVGEHGVVLDAALGVEDQGLGAGAVGEVGDLLGEQQVQPAQPLGTGDAHDAAVGAVDDAGPADQRALLAERVAVVGGDGSVGAGVGATVGALVAVGTHRGLRGDRARLVEGRGRVQGRGHYASFASSASARSAHARQVPESATWVASRRKPVRRAQRLRQGLQRVDVDLVDRAAVMTDQVDVLVLGRRVRRRAVPEMGVLHDAELLQQVQRAVDRGDVHRGRRLLHPRTDGFRRRVAELDDRVEHQLALRGHAQATAVQRLPQFGVHPVDGRPRTRREPPGGRGRLRASAGGGPYDREGSAPDTRRAPWTPAAGR